MRGDGIWWTFRWHQKELNAWCEELPWRDWIEDKMRFNNLHDTSRDLLQLAAEWSLLSVSGEMKQAGISIKGVSAYSTLLPGWSPVLTLNQGDKKLDLFLVDWPADALRWLIKGWTPLVAAAGSANPMIRCPITVGRMDIPFSLLKRYEPGSVVVLPAGCHMYDVHYWMIVADVLIKLVSHEEGYIVSEIITEEQNEIIDTKSVLTSLDDITVNVSFEIGSTLLSFADLATLKPGSVLKSELNSAAAVNIRVNGHIFATGDFIFLGDVPGVRVNKLLQG